jgi:hypothetical protein
MSGVQIHVYNTALFNKEDLLCVFLLSTGYNLYHNPPIIVPGRVVVVGWEGGLRWIYTAHSKINVATQFNPSDVVTTTAGHIIVCDSSTHALHVLSVKKKGRKVYCATSIYIV